MICQVEEDTNLSVFILVWYTSPHKVAFNECASSRDTLREREYQKITNRQIRCKLQYTNQTRKNKRRNNPASVAEINPVNLGDS